jgi:CRP/FNR family transcriptional regulator, cyclic AMP receptor protein
METKELLRRVKIFEGLSEEEIDKFASIATEESFPPKSIIIEEGTEGRALYIVRRGTVSVSKVDGEVEIELVKLVAGAHFGEMSLIEDQKTSARVTAYNDVDCLVLGKEMFLNLMEREVGIAAKVYKNFTLTLSDRLRTTSRELLTWKPEMDKKE